MASSILGKYVIGEMASQAKSRVKFRQTRLTEIIDYNKSKNQDSSNEDE